MRRRPVCAHKVKTRGSCADGDWDELPMYVKKKSASVAAPGKWASSRSLRPVEGLLSKDRGASLFRSLKCGKNFS
jgi:hypothetical protein